MLDIKATLSVGLVLAGSVLVPVRAEVVTFASSEEPVIIEESMTEASPETICVEDGEEFVSCYDDVYVDACHKPGVFSRIKNSISRIRCHLAGSLSFRPHLLFSHPSACVSDDCCEEICSDVCSCGDICECVDGSMWEETTEPAEEVPLESTPTSPQSTPMTSTSPTSTPQPCKDCGPYVKPTPVRTSIPATPASPRIVGSMRTDIAAPVSERTSQPAPMAPKMRPITETPRIEQDLDLVPVPAEPVSDIQPMSGTLPSQSPGHAENFSWIQGELQRVHTRGGAWVIRYLPLDQTDEYGGSFVLTFDRRLESFRDGQQVRITGELIQARSGSTQEGPRYRIRQISAVDR